MTPRLCAGVTGGVSFCFITFLIKCSSHPCLLNRGRTLCIVPGNYMVMRHCSVTLLYCCTGIREQCNTVQSVNIHQIPKTHTGYWNPAETLHPLAKAEVSFRTTFSFFLSSISWGTFWPRGLDQKLGSALPLHLKPHISKHSPPTCPVISLTLTIKLWKKNPFNWP